MSSEHVTSDQGKAGALKRFTVRELEQLPAMLTVEEACRVLGMGRSSGFESVRRGIIPSVRLSPGRIGIPTNRLRRQFHLVDEEGASHE